MKEYKHLFNAIGSFLKTHGFTKKGDTFYFLSEGNWGLVSFQKSKGSSKGAVKFTINLGVQSTTLTQVLGSNNSDKPSIEDCHWKKRIGFLLPQKQDYWWVIEENSTSMENLVGCMANNLIGVWKSDPDDVTTQQLYGNVTMDFRENGDLIYTVTDYNKTQKIFMMYEINENFLITDQVSYPQKMETEFFIDIKRGILELFFDGAKSKYIKVT
jgi:hypothetical protein